MSHPHASCVGAEWRPREVESSEGTQIQGVSLE